MKRKKIKFYGFRVLKERKQIIYYCDVKIEREKLYWILIIIKALKWQKIRNIERLILT